MPPSIRSIRLPAYDYRSPGAYFVTICADHRQLLFETAAFRQAVESAWFALTDHFPHVELDEFVVMPNHVHGIIWIVDEVDVVAQHAARLHGVQPARIASGGAIAQHAGPLQPQPRVEPGSLGAIVRSFKSASTKCINEIRRTPSAPVWQRNYYERVIRDEDELRRVRQYIIDNPAKWQLDRENPSHLPDTAYEREWGWLEGDRAQVSAKEPRQPYA